MATHLSHADRVFLEERGISESVARKAGWYTEEDPTEVSRLLNQPLGWNGSGALVMVGPNGYRCLRLDSPRYKDGKPIKYELPRGANVVTYLPRPRRIAKSAPQIWITEGPIKAQALHVSGKWQAVGLAGVWGWVNPGTKYELREELAEVNWSERVVYIAFDADPSLKTIEAVDRAKLELANTLLAVGCRSVYDVQLPLQADGSKQGIDDYLVEQGTAALDSLVDHAKLLTGALSPTSFTELARQYPSQRPAVIDGIAREGETVNLIGSPKVGKSWLVYDLLLAITNGREWLGFPTTPGPVLLVDNELHPEALAYRIQLVAEALKLPTTGLDILPLRGQLADYCELAKRLRPEKYKAIVIDAHYRALPAGTSENDNAEIMRVYNLIDGLAAKSRAAFFLVHHSTKGSQADKDVSDVGAGAGSQSRAADTHLVLRPHKEEGAFIMDGLVRSFPRPKPVVARWQFPLWIPDPSLLPELATPTTKKQETAQKINKAKALKLLAEGPLTANVLRQKIHVGREKAEALLDELVDAGAATRERATRSGNETWEYRLSGGCLEQPQTTLGVEGVVRPLKGGRKQPILLRGRETLPIRTGRKTLRLRKPRPSEK